MAFSECFDNSISEWNAKNSTDTEEVLDYLLTAASNAYEGTEATEPEQQISSPSHTPVNGPSSHSSLPAIFARPVSDSEIIHARLAGIPQTTKNDTKYCVNVWEEWRKQRQQTCSTHIPKLTDMTTTQLSACMTRFMYSSYHEIGFEIRVQTAKYAIFGKIQIFSLNSAEDIVECR